MDNIKVNNIKGIEGCIGCSASDETGQCATFPIDAKGNKCPCRICLVKSMCQYGCDLWEVFRGDKE